MNLAPRRSLAVCCLSLALACSTGASGDDGFANFTSGNNTTLGGDGDGDAETSSGEGDGDGDGDGDENCGNGTVETGEQCDLGPDNSPEGQCTH